MKKRTRSLSRSVKRILSADSVPEYHKTGCQNPAANTNSRYFRL